MDYSRVSLCISSLNSRHKGGSCFIEIKEAVKSTRISKTEKLRVPLLNENYPL